MMMREVLFRLSLTTLVCIFLVIIAGSVVRMTGSGMGCPDWPKCFGYYIPPTKMESLLWIENRSFKKGNIIIKDEALFVAKSDFIAGENFDKTRWEPYTKHTYALFDPLHTWVEYINRLIGAFTGLPAALLFICSIFYFRKDLWITILSFAGILLLAFEAWLGKVVVDGNLIPHHISYHLFGALALVALYTYLVFRTRKRKYVFPALRRKSLVYLGLIGVVLLLIQIYLGVHVREEVDALGKYALVGRSDWVNSLSIVFEFHRTFSLIVLGILGYFSYLMIRTRSISTLPRVLLIFLVLEVIIGVSLAYLNMPAFLQPIHLFFAVLELSLLLALIFAYMQKTTPQDASSTPSI